MYSHYRRGLFALGATVGLLALAGTASASVPGAQRVDSPPSLTNSVPVKSATATCPPGKQVTGVGGEITGGLGEVSMNRLEPDTALKSVTVRAEEVGGNSGRQWSVQAYAMCANTIAGSQRVSVSRFVTGVNSEATARAQCPAGQRLLGAGGAVDQSTAGRVILAGIRFEASTIADARGQEIPGGDAAAWRVTSHAICAPPLSGQVNATLQSAFDSATSKTRGIGCPAGKNLLGGAGFVSGEGHVVLDDLRPSTTGFTALAREVGSFDGSWIVSAGAICA
jgi:hypothetical protein